MRLYNLALDVRAALDALEDSPDQEAALQTLQGLQGTLEERCESVGLRVLEIGREIASVEAESKRLLETRDRLDRQREWLKGYLRFALDRVGLIRVDGNLCKIRRQKTPPSVLLSRELTEALDQGADVRPMVGPEFVRVIPERQEIDKRAILKQFKETNQKPEHIEIESGPEAVIVW